MYKRHKHIQEEYGGVSNGRSIFEPFKALTDADNVTHYDIPLSTIKAVQLEMLAAYGAAHAKKQELRTQVEVATDKTALSAIIINF